MEFDHEFLSRLRAANHQDGAEIFPQQHRQDTSQTRPPRPTVKPGTYRRSDVSPSRGWGYWFLLIAVAAFAYGIGGWTHATAIPAHKPNSATDVPAETVTVTVTKEVTVTKTVPALPKECSDALQLVLEIEQASGTVIDSGGRMTDLLKQARLAITEKDHQKLNSVGTQVNNLENQTSGSTAHLLDLQGQLASKLQDCNHALGR